MLIAIIFVVMYLLCVDEYYRVNVLRWTGIDLIIGGKLLCTFNTSSFFSLTDLKKLGHLIGTTILRSVTKNMMKICNF